VRKPSSVAARKTRMAISLRLATSNLRWRSGGGTGVGIGTVELIFVGADETQITAGNQ
jgi:hypothetical protein